MNNDEHHVLLSVVIPAFNEEHGISKTLEQLTTTLPDVEIIVVDDGSTDNTARVVASFQHNVRLLKQPFNRGYGASLKAGMLVARGQFIAWFDADNEHRAEDLQIMLQRIQSENLAAVLGKRPNSINLVRGVGKYLIRLTGRLLKVRAGTDLNCGLRVFRRDVITPYLMLLPDGYSASLTSTVIMIERRYPFAFQEVTLNPRSGSSKVALSDGFEAFVLLLRVITLFAPMRVFMRAGLGLMVTGLLYGLGMALWAGRGFPVAAALMINTGLVLGVMGLIADQISQMRILTLSRGSPDQLHTRTDKGVLPPDAETQITQHSPDKSR